MDPESGRDVIRLSGLRDAKVRTLDGVTLGHVRRLPAEERLAGAVAEIRARSCDEVDDAGERDDRAEADA